VEAGILFHFARRTDECGNAIKCAAGCFGIGISKVKPCTNESYLNGRIANMLKKTDMLFIVGRSGDRRPDCAAEIFKTLEIPLDGAGEPKGVMALCGVEKEGYVIESIKQAIIILPDFPEEISAMLPAVFSRLGRKFGLEGSLPETCVFDGGKILRDCLEHAGGASEG